MRNELARTVLVVDDEELYRNIIKEVLTPELGFRVIECGSVTEAKGVLPRNRIDLIVLDYKLPDSSGLNLLQWMHEQKLEIPVLMLTGEGSEVIAVEAMKLGAYDYIRKEHLEMNRLPIILNAINERRLFKEEREMMNFIKQEREKYLSAIEAYQSAISSFSHVVNNALAMISLNLEEFRREIEPYVMDEGRERFLSACSELRQEYDIVAATLKSVREVSNSLVETFKKPALHENKKEEPVKEPVPRTRSKS